MSLDQMLIGPLICDNVGLFSVRNFKSKMQTAAKVAIMLGILTLLGVLGYLMYRYFRKSDDVQPVKCPKEWKKQNSPVCPNGTQIDPQSECNCIPCSEGTDGTTKTP